MLQNIVQPGQTTEDDIIRHMRNANWICTVSIIQLYYVTFTALLMQHCLQQHTTMLRYTYFSYLVTNPVNISVVLLLVRKFLLQGDSVARGPKLLSTKN